MSEWAARHFRPLVIGLAVLAVLIGVVEVYGQLDQNGVIPFVGLFVTTLSAWIAAAQRRLAWILVGVGGAVVLGLIAGFAPCENAAIECQAGLAGYATWLYGAGFAMTAGLIYVAAWTAHRSRGHQT